MMFIDCLWVDYGRSKPHSIKRASENSMFRDLKTTDSYCLKRVKWDIHYIHSLGVFIFVQDKAHAVKTINP